MPELREYACNKFKSMRLHFKGNLTAIFVDGLCETDDPKLQAAIESHGWYKVHIHPRFTEAKKEGAKAPSVSSQEVEEKPHEAAEALIAELSTLHREDLIKRADDVGLKVERGMRRSQIITAIVERTLGG